MAKPFREHVRQMRKRRKITQQDIATVLGVQRTAVTKMEAGTQEISIEHAELIARFLHEPLCVLVGHTHGPYALTPEWRRRFTAATAHERAIAVRIVEAWLEEARELQA